MSAASSPTDREERAALYLAALATPGLGVVGLRRLIDRFGNVAALAAAPAHEIGAVRGWRRAAGADVPHTIGSELAAARAQVRAARAGGLALFTWDDPDYPPALRHDPSGCAPVLFVEGRLPPQLMLPSDKLRSCALVGKRRASDGGVAFARDLARSAAREGLIVVSGLARGIDAAAHEGALEAAVAARTSTDPRSLRRYRWGPAASQELGPLFEPTGAPHSTDVGADDDGCDPAAPGGTVAVLGGGHGHLYPAGHRGLAARIVAEGGAIVSEWPPDFSPRPETFLRRNRTISGLARVVAVVEAGLRSGANNTVSHALEQGRTVMAVPAAPWQPRGLGCLELLRQGAGMIVDESDLLEQFDDLEPVNSRRPAREAASAAPWDAAGATVEQHLEHLLMNASELHLDTLLGELSTSPGELIGLLARLELAGKVSPTGGGRFRWRHDA